MDDVVQEVAGKTGVDQETVRKVLTAAVEVVKGKLPGPIASQVDHLMGRGGDGMFGGLFGGK